MAAVETALYEQLAVDLARELARAVTEDRKQYLARTGPDKTPEELAKVEDFALDKVLGDNFVRAFDAVQTLRKHYSMALQVCAIHLEGAIETRSELVGRTVTTHLEVGGVWVGSVSITNPGEGEACLLRQNFVWGVAVEVDGILANKYLCANPEHKTKEQT